MRLPPQAIQEFQALWRAEYGEDLDEPTARSYGERLLTMLSIIYRPTPEPGRPPPKNIRGPP
ncbi:MAG: hypothetical protein HY459_03515 [Parcubacteria group bacterium]|nr:hypothetical protein [Parcubacteria group bacterium]